VRRAERGSSPKARFDDEQQAENLSGTTAGQTIKKVEKWKSGKVES
jgi:hypothetical protein